MCARSAQPQQSRSAVSCAEAATPHGHEESAMVFWVTGSVQATQSAKQVPISSASLSESGWRTDPSACLARRTLRHRQSPAALHAQRTGRDTNSRLHRQIAPANARPTIISGLELAVVRRQGSPALTAAKALMCKHRAVLKHGSCLHRQSMLPGASSRAWRRCLEVDSSTSPTLHSWPCRVCAFIGADVRVTRA